MGDLLRSCEMSLLRLYIKARGLGTACATRGLTNAQVEVAHETLNELGELGVLEFKDVRGTRHLCSYECLRSFAFFYRLCPLRQAN